MRFPGVFFALVFLIMYIEWKFSEIKTFLQEHQLFQAQLVDPGLSNARVNNGPNPVASAAAYAPFGANFTIPTPSSTQVPSPAPLPSPLPSALLSDVPADSLYDTFATFAPFAGPTTLLR